MSKRIINYQQFLKGYRTGEFSVLVNKQKAGDFVMSKFADKHNKPAHLFWTWLSIFLLFPASIIFLILFGWIYAVGSFILGLTIRSAAGKSASQFVLQNMLENEDFCGWVLMHKGAIIQDKEGNDISLDFVEELSRKYEIPRSPKVTEKLAHDQVTNIEDLVHKYGKVQEEVSKQMLNKYPAMVFPTSLLPAPKEKVRKAINEAIRAMEYTNYTEDEKKKIIENLKAGLVFLDRFIKDEEAEKINSKLLNNKKYQDAIKKHG